jgi:hypothetical protein
VGALLILGVVITACGQPSTPPPPAPVEVVQPPPPTAVPQPVDAPAVQAPAQPPAQTAPEPIQEPEPAGPEPIDAATLQLIQAMWEGSPHGSTYDLGKGPNTYCSRCHSPKTGTRPPSRARPPTCITCKFPTDPELRIAPTMDFVEEEDWAGIGCETCHKTVDGVITGEMAWLNPISMEHEPVSTPNELCQKCHLTTSGVKASGGRGVTHEIKLGGSAHANWAGTLPAGLAAPVLLGLPRPALHPAERLCGLSRRCADPGDPHEGHAGGARRPVLFGLPRRFGHAGRPAPGSRLRTAYGPPWSPASAGRER